MQKEHSLCSGMWKRLIFCGSGSALIKESGSRSKLGSESVEKELEVEAIFFKIKRFWIFKLATIVVVKCNNDNIISNYVTMYAKFPL